MSTSILGAPSTDRLMIFDIAGTTYALPLGEVLEVVEQAGVCCVPTMAKDRGGVMNWHGEALPVVAPHLLLGGEPTAKITNEELRPFLVVSDRPDAGAQLGLPIDGVCGLVDGEPGRVRGNEVVVERRPVDGRVVSVINPQRLVACAEEVIEGAAA
ncbi:MAG: chemotaxis protein CheW [bacterium]|nr:chemotaxis protein CheW [bacterium]MCP5039551.1 chemotaxis protein CheW [bacterium]